MPPTKEHHKLVTVLLQEDDRRAKRGECSSARIGIFLNALSAAEDEPTLAEGLLLNFSHSRLRDRLLRAIGAEPCKCPRAGMCKLCSN